MKKWSAQAPSNIALIKYMGKDDYELNIPSNSSISYTLDHLTTTVEISLIRDHEDRWEPIPGSRKLSQSGIQRYLDHFKMLKDFYQVKDHFLIRSANNFPSDCGLASSASSFAALTKGADIAFSDLGYKNGSQFPVYQLSRMGSGSSCRSFFAPWAVWKKTEVFQMEFPFKNLKHKLIPIDIAPKTISSREAHQRIQNSLLFQDRKPRAEKRLDQLVDALKETNWARAYQICWNEFWDMHAMFETTQPPFRYITPKAFEALQMIYNFWEKNGDGPIVTMDAGPNIHLLFREDQDEIISRVEKFLPYMGSGK